MASTSAGTPSPILELECETDSDTSPGRLMLSYLLVIIPYFIFM